MERAEKRKEREQKKAEKEAKRQKIEEVSSGWKVVIDPRYADTAVPH